MFAVALARLRYLVRLDRQGNYLKVVAGGVTLRNSNAD